MPTVSEQLRQARQAQNLTLRQVADTTKIRSDHVSALEEGKFDVFSAPVYIRGFTRTYATLLKLDVPQIMAALDAELSQTRKFREPPPLTNEKRTFLDFVTLVMSTVNWRKASIILGGLAACLVVTGGWAVWRHYHTGDPLKNLQPGVYHSTQQLSGQTLPLPPPKK